MISVKVTGQESVSRIEVSGHSCYDVSGKDIVCASVSSIVITSVNAIIRMDKDAISYKEDEGYVEVIVNKHSKEIDVLIENMISLLKELEQTYKKFIKVYE